MTYAHPEAYIQLQVKQPHIDGWKLYRPDKMYTCNACIVCVHLVLVLTVGSCACVNSGFLCLCYSGLYSIVLVTNLVTFGLAHTWWVKLPSLVLVMHIIMQALHV